MSISFIFKLIKKENPKFLRIWEKKNNFEVDIFISLDKMNGNKLEVFCIWWKNTVKFIYR